MFLKISILSIRASKLKINLFDSKNSMSVKIFIENVTQTSKFSNQNTFKNDTKCNSKQKSCFRKSKLTSRYRLITVMLPAR